MTATAEFAPRHFSGLDGARTITTHQFLMTEMAVQHCIRRQALGLFTGSAGTGKTFAIEAATADLELPVVRTLFGSQTTKREVARRLIQEVNGFTPSGTYYDLAEDVVDLFRTPYVAVIDEAQHLNQDCTFFLRYLIDHPDTKLAILLVGADGLITKIKKDPTLSSRVFRRIAFADVPEAELLRALPGYHPIYKDVKTALLEELIDRCEVVKHRTLAVFTLTASDLIQDQGKNTLDEQTLDQSLALISGE